MRTLVERNDGDEERCEDPLPQDHPYDEVNTIKYGDRRGSMTRLCRTCIYERNPSRRVRRRAQGQAQ